MHTASENINLNYNINWHIIVFYKIIRYTVYKIEYGSANYNLIYLDKVHEGIGT